MSSTEEREEKTERKRIFINMYLWRLKHFPQCLFVVLMRYLLELLGDAEAGVDPLSALCVFGLIVLQEVASGELSGYKSDQRQV